MTIDVLPSADSGFGRRVRLRLSDERIIWFTTTGADGTPQPNPVWFLWEEPDSFLVYNRPDAHRLAHVVARPRVALHFDGNGEGGDIVVFTGRADLDPDLPPAHQSDPYLAKYREAMIQVSGGVEAFAAQYPAGVRVRVDRVRGF